MYFIALHHITLFAYHGMYAEENVLGNFYDISVKIGFYTQEEITHINQTINYEKVLNIIKKQMSIPTPLLETILQRIEFQINKEFNEIKSLYISIAKKNPPLGISVASSEVSLSKNY